MAYYIKLQTGEILTWYINQDKPMKEIKQENEFNGPRFPKIIISHKKFDNVIELMADGHELDNIKLKIKNIPIGYN